MTDYRNVSDLRLMELLRLDDAAAFTEILKRHRAGLMSYALRKLADVPLAEDLVQDVLTMLWEQKRDIIVRENFQGFIYKALHNRILGYFRRRDVVRKYATDFSNCMCSGSHDADYLLRYRDFHSYIEKEIAALPKNMNAVFCLNRKEHLSRREIASVLDMPESSVRTNMGRALKILKRQLYAF